MDLFQNRPQGFAEFGHGPAHVTLDDDGLEAGIGTNQGFDLLQRDAFPEILRSKALPEMNGKRP